MYELSYISKIGNIENKYFSNIKKIDDFVFSNDVIVIYVYDFSKHNYSYVGNFNEILDYLFYKVRIDFLNEIIKKERERD